MKRIQRIAAAFIATRDLSTAVRARKERLAAFLYQMKSKSGVMKSVIFMLGIMEILQAWKKTAYAKS